MLGYLLSIISIAWCSYSASAIFSSVLRLSSQRVLVAYPVGLLSVPSPALHCALPLTTPVPPADRYAAFALLSVFDGHVPLPKKA